MRSNSIVEKGKNGTDRFGKVRTIPMSPQYTCARESCSKAGLTRAEIEKIEKYCDVNRITASLRAATTMRKGGKKLDEILWILDVTRKKKTIVMLILALAVSDIDAVNIATDLKDCIDENFVSYNRSGDIQLVSIGNNEPNSQLECALDACKETQIAEAEINEILFLSEEKKIVACLRAACIMRIGKLSHDKVCMVIQASTGYRGNVLTGLAYMFADPNAFNIAMDIYDNVLEQI